MKLQFSLLFSLLMLISTNYSSAQKRNMDAHMKDFLNTPFMIEYQKLQLEMRGLVKDFIEDRSQYSTTEFRKVRDAYNKTSRAFNEVLVGIETDMMDKYTRRAMQKSPDLYQSKLQLQMGNLKDIYANEFLQTLSDIKGEAINGGPFLITLTSLTQLTISVVDFFVKTKWQHTQFNQAFIRDRLVNPYRFPNWDQVLQGMNQNPYGGGYDDFSNNNGYNNGNGAYPQEGNYNNNGGMYNGSTNNSGSNAGYNQGNINTGTSTNAYNNGGNFQY